MSTGQSDGGVFTIEVLSSNDLNLCQVGKTLANIGRRLKSIPGTHLSVLSGN